MVVVVMMMVMVAMPPVMVMVVVVMMPRHLRVLFFPGLRRSALGIRCPRGFQ
jgi:hypothetical protein